MYSNTFLNSIYIVNILVKMDKLVAKLCNFNLIIIVSTSTRVCYYKNVQLLKL